MRQDGDKGNERKETGRRRLAKEAYFIDIVFFFSPTRVFEQTLAPIRIAGLEQLDGPSTYRHAVQQQCSRCVLCLSWSVLSWAGLASWEVLELVLAGDLASVSRQTLFNVCLPVWWGRRRRSTLGGPNGGEEGDRTKRGEGEGKKEWLGVWALEAVVTRRPEAKKWKKSDE